MIGELGKPQPPTPSRAMKPVRYSASPSREEHQGGCAAITRKEADGFRWNGISGDALKGLKPKDAELNPARPLAGFPLASIFALCPAGAFSVPTGAIP
jgi:hypothetical protein